MAAALPLVSTATGSPAAQKTLEEVDQYNGISHEYAMNKKELWRMTLEVRPVGGIGPTSGVAVTSLEAFYTYRRSM